MATRRWFLPWGVAILGCIELAALPIPCAAAPSPAEDEAAPESPGMTAADARRLAGLSLACMEKPWPNKPGHVIEKPGQLRAPKDLTPAFHGCFDWHSAVHGHWALVRVLKSFRDLPDPAPLRAALGRHLRKALLDREQAFLGEARNRTFERPYGWAWYLRLAAELATWDDPDGRRWSAAVAPLARKLAESMVAYLGRLSVPVREGVHPNTAFALSHAWDYAKATGDEGLASALEAAARRFYLADRNCPLAYEPSGEDFLSPCMAEADLMRRILPPGEFLAWLDGFLPAADRATPAPVLDPPVVRDRQDPRIGHLIGLDFHRAWCLEGVASVLPASGTRAAAWRALAAKHREAGLRDMVGSGYGGEHWLASFVLYLATGAGR